jgi:hypothetical protein
MVIKEVPDGSISFIELLISNVKEQMLQSFFGKLSKKLILLLNYKKEFLEIIRFEKYVLWIMTRF